ncbi:MAG: acyl-CoA dehydrogenase family protein, partial [Acidimicrobiales bacterium]
VFHSLSAEEELDIILRGRKWQRKKLDAGFGAIDWPEEFGGAGLSAQFAQVYRDVESEYVVPRSHELFRVTVGLIAPTLRELGTSEQRDRFCSLFLSAEELACQLFSEPSAGSDLAAVSTRAVRSGDSWVVSGSKIWTSGAQFSQWGELIARTDPNVPKHAGLTAFMVPMSSPGITVRPIRQMTGGASFCEVFFDDVVIADDLRIGEVGSGWGVALTTLGFERGQSGSRQVGGSWKQLRALAEWSGKGGDAVIRQHLAAVYAHERLRSLTRLRAEAARMSGKPTGPEGSLGKLLWSQGMTMIGDAAAQLLGPRLAANTGEWGTFAWAGHLLGAPGYHIAGGSDEIQRNIIAERCLGLPQESRVDRDVPWKDVLR